MKYSKCYLCKLPVVNQTIQKFYSMDFVDQNIEAMKEEMFADVPYKLSTLKHLGKYFQYENKNTYSSLSLLFADNATAEELKKITQFMSAVECVTMGFELHQAIETQFKPNTIIHIGLTLLKKVIKDKYLVLAGDYLHIRGSVLASKTGEIEISRLLAKMEIDLCKYVHHKDVLKKKIAKEGYEKITVEEIYQISLAKASQMIDCLKGIDFIVGKSTIDSLGLSQAKKDELF